MLRIWIKKEANLAFSCDGYTARPVQDSKYDMILSLDAVQDKSQINLGVPPEGLYRVYLYRWEEDPAGTVTTDKLATVFAASAQRPMGLVTCITTKPDETLQSLNNTFEPGLYASGLAVKEISEAIPELGLKETQLHHTVAKPSRGELQPGRTIDEELARVGLEPLEYNEGGDTPYIRPKIVIGSGFVRVLG